MVAIETNHNVSDDDVVISGFSGRFPMSDNIEELGDNLFRMADLVQPIDDPLWRKNKLQVPLRVGQINNKNKFDAVFFGVNRKQSSSLDIMTRLILERAYEAIVDAGMNPQELSDTNTFVLTSASISESENTWLYSDFQTGMEFMGHSRAMLANRISFWLNVNGPSYALTSMETGGAEAITVAYEGIKEGRFDNALIGAISLILLPEISYHYKQLGLISPDGTTRSFDASANGYARSDGVAVMLLQRAKHAKRIYATVVHSETEICGDRQAPIIRPLQDKFAEMLEHFYETCGVDPTSVDFLEADGSGIKEWDEEELNAVDRAMLKNRSTPLLVGSIKSNAGHCNAASSFFSVAKVLIAMQTGRIPPNLHFKQPLPTVPALVQDRLKVVTETTPWNCGLAAVNSIGMSGMFGHTLLRAYEKKVPKKSHSDGIPRLVFLSGRVQDGLRDVIRKLEASPVDVELIRLLHDVYSVSINNHLYRAYTILPAGGKPYQEVEFMDSGTRRPLWYVFSGMGSQWPGMGRDLIKLPLCAASIEKCHDILKEKGVDLKNILTSEDPSIFDNILHCFVSIAAIQVVLVDLLEALGLKPDGIIGHSTGELGCSYADGCLTMEQVLLAAYYRGEASLKANLIKGTMAAVGLSYTELQDRLPPEVDIACHNSSTSTTLSGPTEPLQNFVELLKSEGVFARVVNVANIAYHSRYIRPVAPFLMESLKKVIPKSKQRSPNWVCTSVPEDKWSTPLGQYCSPEFHTNNLLSPVLFEEGCKHIPKNAIIVEIAPHGLLQAILRRSMGSDCTNISLTQRGHPEGLHFLLSAIGKIYLNGPIPQVHTLYPPVEYPVSRGTPSVVPLVTWDHSDSWNLMDDVRMYDATSGEADFAVSLNHAEDRVYANHIIDGTIIYPTFGYLKLVWRTLALLQDVDYMSMPVVFEDVRLYNTLSVPKQGSTHLYVMVQRGSGHFEICHQRSVVVTGKITRPENIEKEFVKVVPVADGVTLRGEEVYTELEQRGYQYKGLFRGIHKLQVSEQGSVALVQWSENMVALGETLLQMVLLQAAEHNQTLNVPAAIHKVTVDPLQLSADIQELEAVFHHKTEVVSCRGLQVQRVKVTPFQPESTNPVSLETVKFISYKNRSFEDREQFMDMCVQLVLENCCGPELNVVEMCGSPQQHTQIFDKYPQVNVKTVMAGSSNELSCHLVVVTSSNTLREALGLLKNGFLLVISREREMWPVDSSLVTVAEHSSDGIKLTLFRNAHQVDARTAQVLHLTGDVFSWLDQVKKCGHNERLYVVAEISPCGVGSHPAFVRQLTSDPKLEHVRCVFLSDRTVPTFSLHKEFYQSQLQQDLITNVYHDGVWGGFHRVALKCMSAEKKHSVNTQLLSVLSMDGLTVECLGLNASSMDVALDVDKADKQIGPVEFSGTSADGKRVMGVEHLCWQVPCSWSMEEAATVPLAYSTAYYSLVMTARVRRGESVLVHAGWSSVGQAAIALALDYGCTVFTTVANQEQRLLISQQFPQVSDEHILSLEQFPVDILTKTRGQGIHVIINTLSGCKITNNTKCLATTGRFVQLAKSDLAKNRILGMQMFLKSTAFYGVAAENLFNMSSEWQEVLHSGVEAKIQSGVVRPLQYRVFSMGQADQALRAVSEKHHVERVLLSVLKDKTSLPQEHLLTCDPSKAYLVSGGNAEQCIAVAEWLVLHGARRLALTLHAKIVPNHVTRRVALLKSHHNAEVVLVATPAATCVNSATNLLQVATSAVSGDLEAIFILPTGERNDLAASHLDKASRSISSLHHFVCLLSEDSWRTCELRHQAGLPALAVHWLDEHSEDFNLSRSLHILDTLLASERLAPIITVNEQTRSHTSLTVDKSVDSFLPSSLQELSALGEDVGACALEELPSLSLGMSQVNEVPPLFIIPGLQGPAADVLQPLASQLMFPAFCAKLPCKIKSLQDTADTLVQLMEQVQEKGPYNLVGVSWGGALTLEIAKLLEGRGKETRVILIDGALETTLGMIQMLGDRGKLQANLICRLLQINNTKVREEVLQLSDWSSQLDRGLAELPADMKKNEGPLRTGVATVADHITSLLQYRAEDMLLSGEVILVRPTGSTEDNCGLTQFFKQTVNILTVDGNHRTVLTNRKTADIINHFVW